MEMEPVSSSEMGRESSGQLTTFDRNHEPMPTVESPPPYDMSNLSLSNYQPAPPAYPQQANAVSLFFLCVCVLLYVHICVFDCHEFKRGLISCLV